MSAERFMVTGAMGCLGAWTVKLLVDEGTDVVAFDRSNDDRRWRLIDEPGRLAAVERVEGDITDGDALARLVLDRSITHVVHLAALQVPFVRADPAAGARVNVLGTVNVFEAVRRSEGVVRGLAYASSGAVFGPPQAYPGGVHDDSPLMPVGNLYGVFKQANEGTAAIYASEAGVGSIGLRPFVVYGPGRDQGMTSTPTVAMLAAVAGLPYRISFGNVMSYDFAPDAAAAFIAAARGTTGSAQVYSLPGYSAPMEELVAAIVRAEPSADGKITFADEALASPADVHAEGILEALGPIARTSLADGVASTMAILRTGLQRGLVSLPSA